MSTGYNSENFNPEFDLEQILLFLSFFMQRENICYVFYRLLCRYKDDLH